MEYQRIRDFLLKITAASLALILLVVGVGYISNLALSDRLPETASNIIITLVVIVSAVLTVSTSKRVLRRIGNRAENFTEHQEEVSYRFMQISVYASSLILIVSYVWEVDLSNVLLGAGVLGVLIGLSARQGLGSVISGIIIMTTNMFKVGDWVQFGDKFGRVKEITFFNTKFRSPQGEQHIIPNENITAQDVTNISRGRYRNDLLISVDYDSDLDEVINICDDELQKITAPESDTLIDAFDPTSVKEFGDSGVILSIKIWLKNPSPALLNQTQTTVFTRLHKRFESEGISIPFPQRVISERQSTDEHRADSGPTEDTDSTNE